MTLPLIAHRVRGGGDPLSKIGGRLDMTFAEEVGEVAETPLCFITKLALSDV